MRRALAGPLTKHLQGRTVVGGMHALPAVPIVLHLLRLPQRGQP